MENEIFVPLMEENQIKIGCLIKTTSIDNRTICYLIQNIDPVNKTCLVEPYTLPNFTHISSDLNSLGKEIKRGETFRERRISFEELLLNHSHDISI
ncbi:hypothetical protein ACS6L2_09985 [Aquirufa ecclesiirivi]